MEEVAWRYLGRGDVAGAERLFMTLSSTFNYELTAAGSARGGYDRMLRLCRILIDPTAVSRPQRLSDAVEALSEGRLPIEAFFNTSLTETNAVRLHKWLLMVHPDKNPHPNARTAFLRLVDMKEELEGSGRLHEVGLGTPTVNNVQTCLPPVVNDQRLQREYARKKDQLDVLLNSMRVPKVKLNCDLTFSSFEGTLRDMDSVLEDSDAEDGVGAHSKRGSGPESGSLNPDDEEELTRTVILEGIAQIDCSDTVRSAVNEALRGGSGHGAASPSLLAVSTSRIVLKRPPTQQEWREEQERKSRNVTPAVASPMSFSLHVTSRPHVPSEGLNTSLTMQSVLTSPFNVPLPLPAMCSPSAGASSDGRRVNGVRPLHPSAPARRAPSGKLSPLRMPSGARPMVTPAQSPTSTASRGVRAGGSPPRSAAKAVRSRQYMIPL